MTTNKRLAQSLLTAAAATYYTAPAATTTLVKKVTVTNTSGTAATFSLNIVPSGGSPATGNELVLTKAVGPNATYECFEAENHVHAAGDMLSGLAGTAGVLVLTVSGLEIV